MPDNICPKILFIQRKGHDISCLYGYSFNVFSISSISASRSASSVTGPLIRMTTNLFSGQWRLCVRRYSRTIRLSRLRRTAPPALRVTVIPNWVLGSGLLPAVFVAGLPAILVAGLPISFGSPMIISHQRPLRRCESFPSMTPRNAERPRRRNCRPKVLSFFPVPTIFKVPDTACRVPTESQIAWSRYKVTATRRSLTRPIPRSRNVELFPVLYSAFRNPQSAFSHRSSETVSLWRPLARRRFKISRPALVAIRFLNPWSFLRFRFDG